MKPTFPSRIRVIAVSLVLLYPLALLPGRAQAGCDNIPSETDVFRAAQGSITAPYAVPGQTLQVRVRPEVCDASSVGLGIAPACVDASAVRVTLIYEPRDGAPVNAVVLARDCGTASDPNSLQSRVDQWSQQLAQSGGTATCQRDPKPRRRDRGHQLDAGVPAELRVPVGHGSVARIAQHTRGSRPHRGRADRQSAADLARRQALRGQRRNAPLDRVHRRAVPASTEPAGRLRRLRRSSRSSSRCRRRTTSRR